MDLLAVPPRLTYLSIGVEMTPQPEHQKDGTHQLLIPRGSTV